MNWNKAGRPLKRSTEQKSKFLKQEYTKEELYIPATERACLCTLSVAVIKQWVLDGKPVSDIEGITPWIQILKDLTSENSKLDNSSLSNSFLRRINNE